MTQFSTLPWCWDGCPKSTHKHKQNQNVIDIMGLSREMPEIRDVYERETFTKETRRMQPFQ